MKVETMRFIDKWAGIPLCFLMSPVAMLTDFLRGSGQKKTDLSRTLFIELSEMGSAILADPALRKIKKQTGGELYFAIFKKNHKSLAILKTVPEENIFKMDASHFGKLVVEVIRFVIWCRRKKITAVIDLELFSRFTALLSFFSGAAFRIGFTNLHDEGLFRGWLINRGVRYNPHVHIAVNFLSLTHKALGQFSGAYATAPVHDEDLILARAEVSEVAMLQVKEKIRQLYPGWNRQEVVLMNVNASDMLPQRRWPAENFVQTAKELINRFQNIIILLTGAPDEKDYVEQVASLVAHERCINAAGFFSFEELIPLYRLSTFMLTNDSGPAHFASVTTLKVFVLFGPETPKLYLPLGGNAEPIYLGLPCSPCVSAANHRKTSCTERPCITGIHPQRVIERLREYLEQKKTV
ncbi:MAG: hypothetical protein N2747_06290 [Chitinophagaceae bacterium]|nr:hypothetical protein [Chitinophagaceae bacterium]